MDGKGNVSGRQRVQMERLSGLNANDGRTQKECVRDKNDIFTVTTHLVVSKNNLEKPQGFFLDSGIRHIYKKMTLSRFSQGPL